MKTIEITEAFSAYEDGKKVVYEVGQKPSLQDDLAALYVRKGHAKSVKAAKPEIEGESE